MELPPSRVNRSRGQRSRALFNIVVTAMLVVFGAGIEHRYQLFARYVARENTSRVASTRLSELFDTSQPSEYSQADLHTFWQVWDILVSEHLNAENLTEQGMVDAATAGLTRATGDPYTYYLTPEEFTETSENMAGRFFGVGIELGYSAQGVLAVMSPIEDSPAERAGVRAGDLIVHVRDQAKGIDEDSGDWTLEKAVRSIRGERGTEIVLTLVREGANEPIEVVLVRDQIKIPSLEIEFVEQNGQRVAHVQLSQFGQNTLAEWEKIVSDILREKPYINGIVLDLRGNSGGFLNTAIAIAGDFFDKGIVVSQQGRYQTQDFRASGAARLEGIPVVVLVNRGSASASEILAGALRDQIGAKLIGQRTFGKGTIQDRKELPNGGGIHVTIAQWLLPAGGNIHKEGIEVDVEVEYNPDTEEDEQLIRAIEEL